jgi:hypothetical protein
MTINAIDILNITKSVTKKWTKQRKAEERGSRSRLSRMSAFEGGRVSLIGVADHILPGAYDHASGGGKYSVSKRQLYYACREEFKLATGRELKVGYFSNTLLLQYMNRHPDETASWKITADPRGTLTIPNADHEVQIPCGTLAIEEHLASASEPPDDLARELKIPIEYPSLKEGLRYQAVLYIEKEGFEPQLEEAKIGERYDLAIISCKGQSVVAARQFVDQVCGVGDGVPLLVVHDFDKAGFEISQRLTTVSARAEETDRVAYDFQNSINVTDLGLRLADVEKYGLSAETCDFTGHFASDSICTPEEREFLRSGQRVELNAFTSPQFIEWLETKLRENGLGKRLVPDDDLLEAAYRRAAAVAHINHAVEDTRAEAERKAEELVIPRTLRRQVQMVIRESDEPWDKAVYRLVREKLGHDSDD